MLLLPELEQLAASAPPERHVAVRVSVTPAAPEAPAFPGGPRTSVPELQRLHPHVTFASGRVDEASVRQALAGCEGREPRVILSGPTGFMQAVSRLLERLDVPRAAIVRLKA